MANTSRHVLARHTSENCSAIENTRELNICYRVLALDIGCASSVVVAPRDNQPRKYWGLRPGLCVESILMQDKEC